MKKHKALALLTALALGATALYLCLRITRFPSVFTPKGIKDNVAARHEQSELNAKITSERHDRLYDTPIEFYGVVVGEDGLSVSKASVEFMIADPTGDWKWNAMQSNSEGAFKIVGRGRYLDIRVHHPNYYETDSSRQSFTYAGNDQGPDYKASQSNPEAFLLRKKGAAAALVHKSSRVLFQPGEPVRAVNFYDHSSRRDMPGFILARRPTTDERNSGAVLHLQLTVPGGGIVERTDPLVFKAPNAGYQESTDFNRAEFGGAKEYYVRFNNGIYARFQISGSGGQYSIESFLNPTGSNNLEFDASQEVLVRTNSGSDVQLIYPSK